MSDKISNPKAQIPKNFQIPNSRNIRYLEMFRIWSSFGIWDLRFAIS